MLVSSGCVLSGATGRSRVELALRGVTGLRRCRDSSKTRRQTEEKDTSRRLRRRLVQWFPQLTLQSLQSTLKYRNESRLSTRYGPHSPAFSILIDSQGLSRGLGEACITHGSDKRSAWSGAGALDQPRFLQLLHSPIV